MYMHDTLLGNHGMSIQGIIPSGTGKTATCATPINGIDKASSNDGKQRSSVSELGKVPSAVPVVTHVHDRSTPTLNR